MSHPSPWTDVSNPEPITADQAAKARLYVAAQATDAEDCRNLLQMLGLED